MYNKEIVVRNVNQLAELVEDAVGTANDTTITVIVMDDEYLQQNDDLMVNHLLAVFFHEPIKEVLLSRTIRTYFASHTDALVTAIIINKHLRGDRDILLCQDELIDAGFERWARI